MLEENYNRYRELLLSIDRDGIGDLVEFIDNSDFKWAPASTKYHCDYEGGLCQHSLNVYDNLCKLINLYNVKVEDDTVKIVSLLHDLSKMEFYEKSFQNRKLYKEDGSKSDDQGRFDWVSVMSYKIKDADDRVLAGDHGFNSYFIAKRFIGFTEVEVICILNHHLGMGEQNPNRDLNAICDRFPLLPLLHLADMISCYISENRKLNEQIG